MVTTVGQAFWEQSAQPHQGSHQVQPLKLIASPVWSPQDPPPPTDGHCYLKVAQQSMADSGGGPGCCGGPGAPPEGGSEMSPWSEERRLVGLKRTQHCSCPWECGSLSRSPVHLLEDKPILLYPRGRRKHPYTVCGLVEGRYLGQGKEEDSTQPEPPMGLQGTEVGRHPEPPCPSHRAARTLTI